MTVTIALYGAAGKMGTRDASFSRDFYTKLLMNLIRFWCTIEGVLCVGGHMDRLLEGVY